MRVLAGLYSLMALTSVGALRHAAAESEPFWSLAFRAFFLIAFASVGVGLWFTRRWAFIGGAVLAGLLTMAYVLDLWWREQGPGDVVASAIGSLLSVAVAGYLVVLSFHEVVRVKLFARGIVIVVLGGLVANGILVGSIGLTGPVVYGTDWLDIEAARAAVAPSPASVVIEYGGWCLGVLTSSWLAVRWLTGLDARPTGGRD